MIAGLPDPLLQWCANCLRATPSWRDPGTRAWLCAACEPEPPEEPVAAIAGHQVESDCCRAPVYRVRAGGYACRLCGGGCVPLACGVAGAAS